MLPVLPTRFSHAPVFLRARLLRCPDSYAPGFLTRRMSYSSVFSCVDSATSPLLASPPSRSPLACRKAEGTTRTPGDRARPRKRRRTDKDGPPFPKNSRKNADGHRREEPRVFRPVPGDAPYAAMPKGGTARGGLSRLVGEIISPTPAFPGTGALPRRNRGGNTTLYCRNPAAFAASPNHDNAAKQKTGGRGGGLSRLVGAPPPPLTFLLRFGSSLVFPQGKGRGYFLSSTSMVRGGR